MRFLFWIRSARVALVLVGLAVVSTRAQAGQPVLPDFQADPSARVMGGKLYIYASHDLARNRTWDNMLDFHAFVSIDAKTFSDAGKVFGIEDVTWARKQLWAPDCIERDGKCYLYFAAEGQIGVAVSNAPMGPFKDALGKPLLSRRTQGLFTIDPCVFIDDDGQAYLYFGNSSEKVGVAKLKKDMISLDGPVQLLSLKNYHEGIWVHKRDGLYYFSHPSHRGEHVANLLEYSTSKSPTGPFEYRGVILDNRSRNVHGSITDFGGKSYVVYHIQGPSPYERRTYMNEITYNADGTIQPLGVVEGMKEPTTQPAAK